MDKKLDPKNIVGVSNSAIFTLAGFGSRRGDATIQKAPKPNATETMTTGDWMPWGADNDFPRKLLEKLGKISLGFPNLQRNADIHYGQGLITYKREIVDGKIQKTATIDTDWEDWSEKCNFGLNLTEIIESLEIFYIAFPLFIMNKERTRVNRVICLDTSFCRIGKMNDNGFSDKIYYSATFPNPQGKEYYEAIEVYNPEWKEGKYPAKFVYPIYYKTWGNVFHPKPGYYSVFENQWVDVAISVPKLKAAIFANQATIKFHVELTYDYLRRKFEDWDTCGREQQDLYFQQVVEEWDNNLSGEDGGAKTIITTSGFNTATGKQESGVTITAIDNKFKDQMHLPDASAANREIMFAMSNDPSLVGATEHASKIGAGSGSDKKQGNLMMQQTAQRDRECSLQIPYLVKFINKFNSDLKFDYLDMDISETMDVNPTSKSQKI